MNSIKVELDVPEELFFIVDIPKENLGEEIKKLFSLELYREGLLSLGKLCSLTGLTKYEFFELNKKAKIPINITEEQWEKDRMISKELI
jgi:predicted HTH domain antitoxin